MHLLLIEDEREVADFIQKGLEEVGHQVCTMHNGRDGLAQAISSDFDVLIIDRMLPELDGLSIVKALRASGDPTPVLFLSALGQVDERVRGLKAGGDDYLTKPFAFSELLARLDALSRRPPGREAEVTELVLADLRMDLLRHKVYRNDAEIPLQGKEFNLLEQLMRHPGRVMTRTMLLENVWGYHFDTRTNVIDVHMSNLRKKIDSRGLPALLHTVRGAGYKIEAL
ncbi:response regulator transcription factor [Paremcibacter congregatus]|uniref:response regulator transcription factor n=1 Tax=Paremcibacter congregatus TaxID=2043170 RepID=UPI0030EC6FA8